jgi:hypothetical protein
MSTQSCLWLVNYGLLGALVASFGNVSAWAAILLFVLGASLVLFYDWMRGYFE